MNAEWQNKLTGFGLELADGAFVYEAVPASSDVLCTLESDTVLYVTDEGAEAFLQAQFSNDIAALENPGSHLNTWSSPKGRVISVLRVVRIADGFLIKLPQVDSILKRLKMFAGLPVKIKDADGSQRTAKVVIEPREDLIAVGISGEAAMAALVGAGFEVPQQTDATTEIAGQAWVTRVRGEIPRVEVVGTVEKIAELWAVCNDVCKMADESVWRLQNIDAGIPSVGVDTAEEFVLQMMNLHLIDGVDFTKGCFTGQEVVARMHYLGKLKRSMFRLGSEGDTPAPGAELFKAGGGSAVGKIVDAVSVGGNANRLLAVVAIDATNEPLYLDKESKHAVQMLTLPYELTSPE